ncbi:MAG: hypothetical protein ACI956_001920, partial [Nonlabens sp.]
MNLITNMYRTAVLCLLVCFCQSAEAQEIHFSQ